MSRMRLLIVLGPDNAGCTDPLQLHAEITAGI
jgi:hypothetical protein